MHTLYMDAHEGSIAALQDCIWNAVLSDNTG